MEKIGFPDGLISSSPVPQMAIDPSLMRKDFHQKKKPSRGLERGKVKSDISIFCVRKAFKQPSVTKAGEPRKKINEFLNALCAFSFTLKLIT